MYIFEITIKNGFFDIPFDLFKEKIFISKKSQTFNELKSPKCKQRKTVFINRS